VSDIGTLLCFRHISLVRKRREDVKNIETYIPAGGGCKIWDKSLEVSTSLKALQLMYAHNPRLDLNHGEPKIMSWIALSEPKTKELTTTTTQQ